MTAFSTLLVSVALLFSRASALAPSNTPKAKKPAFTVPKAAFGGVAAASLAALVAGSTMADAALMPADPPSFGSSSLVSERVKREGIYGEYEVDLGEQEFDDARSTYKSAKETKSKKGKYTALIAVLVVGSFIIPMAQYFWYVRDDDSSDQFFAKTMDPEPEPEPVKKKGWFS